jgi:DNA-binding transcriptional MerR regulator
LEEEGKVRIGELSRRSGISVPTIKFYLRERLLPPGERTGPNQADYADGHLRRLRLIRALIELAGVPVAGVKEVLESLDSGDQTLHHRIGAVHRAIAPSRQPAEGDGTHAEAQVRALIEKRGWAVEPDAPAIGTLAETVAVLHALGQGDLAADLDFYADVVERLAEREVAAVVSRPEPDRIAESVVIGTILGERLVAALRLLAHEHVSARLLGSASVTGEA